MQVAQCRHGVRSDERWKKEPDGRAPPKHVQPHHNAATMPSLRACATATATRRRDAMPRISMAPPPSCHIPRRRLPSEEMGTPSAPAPAELYPAAPSGGGEGDGGREAALAAGGPILHAHRCHEFSSCLMDRCISFEFDCFARLASCTNTCHSKAPICATSVKKWTMLLDGHEQPKYICLTKLLSNY